MFRKTQKPKLWECYVTIPAEQTLKFCVEAHDEEMAIDAIEKYTHGKCIEISQDSIIEMKTKFSDVMIGFFVFTLLGFIIFHFWKFILIICGLCLCGFLFLSWENLTRD